jgi:hypothetical protein
LQDTHSQKANVMSAEKDLDIQNILEKILKRLEVMQSLPTIPKSNLLVGYVFARAEEMLPELDMDFDQSRAEEDLSSVMSYLRHIGHETVGEIVSTYTPSKLLTDLVKSPLALTGKKAELEDRKERAGVVVAALKLAGLWQP